VESGCWRENDTDGSNYTSSFMLVRKKKSGRNAKKGLRITWTGSFKLLGSPGFKTLPRGRIADEERAQSKK